MVSPERNAPSQSSAWKVRPRGDRPALISVGCTRGCGRETQSVRVKVSLCMVTESSVHSRVTARVQSSTIR
jgi:hypothetical protein